METIKLQVLYLLFFIENISMPWGAFATGFFSLAALDAFRREKHLSAEILFFMSIPGVAGLILWFVLPSMAYSWTGRTIEMPVWHALFWPVFLVAGVLAMVWTLRHGVRILDKIKSRYTLKGSTERQGKTDVREIASSLPKSAGEFDPRNYFSDGEFFIGLDETGQPIYWPGSLPHVSVCGTTGSGKGRELQVLSAQAVRNGEALVYLDPKDDEWAAHAVFSACREAEKPYFFIRLLPENPPQFDLLEGCRAWQIEELFTSAMDLGDKGKGSDFFKAKDRAAAAAAAQLAADGGLTLADLFKKMDDEFWNKEAPGFLGKLREIAGVTASSGKGGFSLPRLVEEGGGAVIVGSMTLQAVKRVQQMVFVRIQQLATERDRMAGPHRVVCVVADEAKYHISRPVLQGLGASRDKGMRVILAYQSFLDLRDCPDDMDPEMVVGGILENTPCKLVYRVEDPETAEWLAKKSGKILVDDETRKLQKNVALAETVDAERSIRQAEAYLIDENKILNFPPGWGALYGAGLARLCHVSPFRVEKRRDAVTPLSAQQDQPVPVAVPGTSENGQKLNNSFFDLEI